MANDDLATTPEDAPADISVLENDTDPDGDMLAIASVGAPAHGTATAVARTVHYVPAPHFRGNDAFSYTVRDTAGATATAQVRVTVTPVNHAPAVTLGALPQSGTAPLTVELTATATDPDGDGLTLTWDFGDGTPVSAGAAVRQHAYAQAGSFTAQVTASDGQASAVATTSVQVTGIPDPIAVATPIEVGVSSELMSATAFLYSGPNPIQTGVAPGTIELLRAAVVRGKAVARDGTPLAGVAITILHHPELGRTATRADGTFDMAVNGGGVLTVELQKPSLLPAQRQIPVPWQQYTVLPDVVLIQLDAAVTSVALGAASMQVAQGGAVQDADGTRGATILFPAGTTATMTLPNGSTQPLPALHVRATEYTVGQAGPATMPAQLPPSSGYTYAFELSADEALAIGARTVTFSQPLIVHVDNFLDFPVGSAVPTGSYDREKAVWTASQNGRVIRITGISAGLADVDTVGASALPPISLDDAERQKLASLFPVGKTLWRVPIPHFSVWDCNWPKGPPPCNSLICPGPPPGGGGGGGGGSGGPNGGGPPNGDCHKPGGSSISCYGQALLESLPITGTGLRLHYDSSRVLGRKDNYTVRIPVSGPELSIPPPKRIELEVKVAGRVFQKTFAPAPNRDQVFEWDGRDAYDRFPIGAEAFKVRVGNVYDAVYRSAADIAASFALPGDAVLSSSRVRDEVTIATEWETTVSRPDNRLMSFAGWSLSVHHLYDPRSRTLFLGTGGQRTSVNAMSALSTIAGGGVSDADGVRAVQSRLFGLQGIAAGPDGSVYTAEQGDGIGTRVRLRRARPDGTMTTLAGTGLIGFSGDGGPATSATFSAPSGVAVGPDGSTYVLDEGNLRVRRIDPDGIITTVAGNGTYGVAGDGGPAVNAQLSGPKAIAVAPDGALYMLETFPYLIRRVGPDGIISRFAGIEGSGYTGDGGPATKAQFSQPQGLAVGPDGSVFISDTWNNRVRRIGPDGIIKTFAGNGDFGDAGDGGPALAAAVTRPDKLAVGPDGSVYISEVDRIRVVSPDGTIALVAGGGRGAMPPGQAPPATAISLHVNGMTVAPDGTLLVADAGGAFRVLRRDRILRGLSSASSYIPAEDGKELYVFDGNGRHLATLDARTAAPRRQFAYDSAGRLISITDADGNATNVVRDGAGNPTGIVAPGGQRSALAVNGDGYLASLTDPGGATVRLTYSGTAGLLTSLTTRRGHLHQFFYDDSGRLARDDNPLGTAFSLSRTDLAPNHRVVSLTSGLGLVNKYELEDLKSGETRRVHTDPAGGRTEVLLRTDGTRRILYPDGSVADVVEGPDPRWGMQAPILASLTRTSPGGTVSKRTASRSITLADAGSPLSLTSQTDSIVLNGRSSSMVFDAAAHTLTATTAGNRQTVAKLDPKGRVVQQSAPGSTLLPVVYTYDSNGRLTRTEQGAQAWSWAYDASHRVVGQSDAAGGATTYQYDGADQVTAVALPSGRMYRLGREPGGSVGSVTMPDLAVHLLDYNALDLDSGYKPPDNASYLRQFDLDRRLRLAALPSGRKETFSYDGGGRPLGLVYPEAAVAFAYAAGDVSPRVASVKRTSVPGGEEQAIVFGYDGGLVTSATWTGVATGQYGYTYGADLRLGSTTLTRGATSVTTTLTRDRDGLLTALGPFSIVRSGPAGKPTQIGDGVLSTALSYDGNGRLAGRVHSVAGKQVYAIQLTFDVVGRISRRVETVGGTAVTSDFEYDADGSLTAVKRSGTAVERYAWDVNRNRSSRQIAGGAVETASYDSQDRLIQQGVVASQFDADGALVARGGATFQYSTTGELLAATVGALSITYSYDGLRRRIGRTDATGTTQYLYGNPDEALQVTETVDPAGVLTRLFYDDGGRLFSFERSGARSYVATDQLGSPRVIADAAGTIVKEVVYDAFGNVTADSSPDLALAIGFAGGLSDPVTGLVRFGFRDYDPVAGSWTGRDPILFGGAQANLYAYVRNDPVDLVDPSGLASVEASAYDGFGGGGKIAIDGSGMSFCAELGVGIGASVGVDVLEEHDDSSLGVVTEAEAKLAIFRAKAKGELLLDYDKQRQEDCGPEGEAKAEAKVCIGIVCGGGEASTADETKPRLGLDTGLEKGTQSLSDLLKGGVGEGVQAKLAAKGCWGFKF